MRAVDKKKALADFPWKGRHLQSFFSINIPFLRQKRNLNYYSALCDFEMSSKIWSHFVNNTKKDVFIEEPNIFHIGLILISFG